MPIGTTDVTCAATDPSTPTLATTRSFRVTVRDTTPPALIVPADFELPAQGAHGRSNVVITATATDAVDGTVTPSCVPEDDATFPIGTTLVTCRAVDGTGQSRDQKLPRDHQRPAAHAGRR